MPVPFTICGTHWLLALDLAWLARADLAELLPADGDKPPDGADAYQVPEARILTMLNAAVRPGRRATLIRRGPRALVFEVGGGALLELDAARFGALVSTATHAEQLPDTADARVGPIALWDGELLAIVSPMVSRSRDLQPEVA